MFLAAVADFFGTGILSIAVQIVCTLGSITGGKVVDNLTKEKRSKIMRSIKSKDTKPELLVRRLLTRLGYRYKLHIKDLPGRPDIVFKGRKKVIFIHGCFWHGHAPCMNGRILEGKFWQEKMKANQARDMKAAESLEQDGWKILTIWECELKNTDALEKVLLNFIGDTKFHH